MIPQTIKYRGQKYRLVESTIDETIRKENSGQIVKYGSTPSNVRKTIRNIVSEQSKWKGGNTYLVNVLIQIINKNYPELNLDKNDYMLHHINANHNDYNIDNLLLLRKNPLDASKKHSKIHQNIDNQVMNIFIEDVMHKSESDDILDSEIQNAMLQNEDKVKEIFDNVIKNFINNIHHGDLDYINVSYYV